MNDTFRANAPQFVIGLFVMLVGGALVLDRLDVVDMAEVVQFWPVILIVLGASVMVQATGPATDGARPPGVPVGSVVLIVLVGLLTTHTLDRRSAVAAAGGGNVALFAVMGGDQRVLMAEPFAGAEMTSVMGETRLDLRHAVVEPGAEVVIDVFAAMGSAIVQVPPGWIVDIRTKSVFGGVRDNRQGRVVTVGRDGRAVSIREDAPADAPVSGNLVAPTAPETAGDGGQSAPAAAPPRLVLHGLVLMGGLSIRS